MRSRLRVAVAGALPLALAALAWRFDRTNFLAAWLAAWCFCAWIAMGGLVTVWIHTLTGGAWAEPLRAPALAASRLLPLLTLLFLPVLAGMHGLYPWADAGRWDDLSAPAFKDAWLRPWPFALRAAAILALWNLLAWAARRPPTGRARAVAATSLILYGASVGVAATDWLMSLTPLWYSSIFGLEIGVGQALAGLAFAVLAAASRGTTRGQAGRDLGNLLFTYVLSWGYLAFCQYLVIWAEDLPHEILWYEARRSLPWPPLGLAVALLQFAIPFLALLFRDIKESPSHLATIAVLLLGAHLLNVCWLILPSVAGLGMKNAWWLLPLCVAGFAALCRAALPDEAWEPRHD
ncbi:MAG: hypothetical protein ACM3Y9_14845 [Ignavibacteria bacterium]